MFNVIIIRLDSVTRVFENTEVNTIFLSGDLKRELQNRNVDNIEISEALSLNKGEKVTVHIEKENKLWFCYITKF